jgi:hypothetical protein
MKALVCWLIVLGMSTALCAQGDQESPNCTQPTISGTDNSCNDFTANCGVNDHGCTGTDFEASCTGDFDMGAWLTGCTSEHCKVCVVVRKRNLPTIVGSCILDVCTDHTDKMSCARAARLETGEEYTLWVCLTYCSTVDDCGSCTSCTAHGCIRSNTQTAPCW